VTVVLAVTALACWLRKPWASPVAAAVDARGAVGVALAEQLPTARPFGSEPVTGPLLDALNRQAGRYSCRVI
jgi:hypothetical protein